MIGEAINVLDGIVQMPWLYRGWAFLLSRTYRQSRRAVWRSRGMKYETLDICMSGFCMVLEICVAVMAVVLVLKR